jgi:hypothetical protein
MEEEKYISDKFGRRNPFTVPEGYFEQLTAQVMNQLPERRQKARRVWMRPVWWAAAAVCALFVSTAAWLVIPNESKPSQGQVAEVIQQSQPDDAYFDAAADYVMLDNQEIYACLSDY